MLADLRLQHYMDSCKHLQLLEKMVESNVTKPRARGYNGLAQLFLLDPVLVGEAY